MERGVRLLHSVITYGAFPLCFGGALAAAFVGLDAGVPAPILLACIMAVCIAVVAACERLRPAFPRWNISQGDVPTDLAHGLVSQVMLPPLLEAGTLAVLLWLALGAEGAVGLDLWPAAWPRGGQLALALLVSQFGEYWAHRAMHEHPFLWRFHATHHSPGRLYWLNAARFHPVDIGLDYLAATLPLMILGAGPELITLYTVWAGVHGIFQHCNIDVRLGPLNYVFSMAELHRWHHSRSLEEANTNYGNNIIFWDLVFGTMYWPRDRAPPEAIGLSELPDFPRGWLGQILSPFVWRRVSGRAEDV